MINTSNYNIKYSKKYSVTINNNNHKNQIYTILKFPLVYLLFFSIQKYPFCGLLTKKIFFNI